MSNCLIFFPRLIIFFQWNKIAKATNFLDLKWKHFSWMIYYGKYTTLKVLTDGGNSKSDDILEGIQNFIYLFVCFFQFSWISIIPLSYSTSIETASQAIWLNKKWKSWLWIKWRITHYVARSYNHKHLDSFSSWQF